MNGALDEAMEIIKGSLADKSQVEKPYRPKGKIFLDENNSIVSIYINGIIVDFEVVTAIDRYTAENTDEDLIDAGWEKVVGEDDITDWIMTNNLSSQEWDKQRNYFDF